jgi:phosphate transport system substrate-binding protein
MQVFTGQISNWKALGGEDQPIKVFVRNRNSGTHTTFKKLVLAPFNQKEHLLMRHTFADNKMLAQAVRQHEGAVGFTSFTEIGANKALSIHEKGAMPIKPKDFTIKTEDYPLSRRLYLYSNTRDSIAQDFVRFAKSQAGQKIVDQIGFVSLRLNTARKVELPKEAPQAYREAVQGAVRLPVNIRFMPQSNQLDNKAVSDLGKLVERLRKPSQTDRKVLLIGFSQSYPDPGRSKRLSKQRAQKVAQYLKKYGTFKTELHWFGDAVPVSGGQNFEARLRNNRVEIWLK